MIKKALVTLAAGGALLAAVAQADIAPVGDVKATAEIAAGPNWVFGTCGGDPFVDDFENYTPGPICGQAGPPGGWEEWSGSTDVCGAASTEQAFSGTTSLKIIGNVGGQTGAGDDQVHQFQIVGGGGPECDQVWTFSVMTFVPNDATGSNWIILLSSYPPDAFLWSLQVEMNADAGGGGTVNANLGASVPGEEVDMIKGRWVEFRAEIDLPNDSVDYFYDGVEFVTDSSWTDRVSGATPRAIRAVDLYAGEPSSPGTSGMFFDDINLTPEGGCADPCDMNCDGTVNAVDIEFFIDILFNNGPRCASCTGDTNGDGRVDAADIEGFIDCLFP